VINGLDALVSVSIGDKKNNYGSGLFATAFAHWGRTLRMSEHAELAMEMKSLQPALKTMSKDRVSYVNAREN
jgi:hypothetical protein